MMQKDARVAVTGAGGLMGRNLTDYLHSAGYRTVLPLHRSDCDLTDRNAVKDWFRRASPSHVFHAAGYVAGIMGNLRNQATSFLQNTLINTHVIEASQVSRVEKIVAMGTVAMYPDPQPNERQPEADLWRAEPHASERGYAHAKRGMLAQLDVFRESYNLPYACAISTNLYGPFDRFDIEHGHVIPSLVRKFYEASQTGGNIIVWGDGSSLRDFLHARDAARALVLMMDHLEGPVNMATGLTHPIRDVVEILAAHTGLGDRVAWDRSKPGGQAYRAYDTSRLSVTNFVPEVDLAEGLRSTYDWYRDNATAARR